MWKKGESKKITFKSAMFFKNANQRQRRVPVEKLLVLSRNTIGLREGG